MPEKISVFVLAAALAGCGGGDGSSATMPLLPSDGGASFTPSPMVPVPSAADPDAVVTTPTRTLDLRWGARASRYVLPTTDNVTARIGLWVESGAYSAPLDLGFYSGVGDLSIQLSTPLFGVAKDAQVFRNDFLTYQRSTQGLFAEFKRWGETNDATGRLYRQIKVFNLSLGGTSRNPTQNTAAYQAQLAFANASQVPDAVFVKAVGNAGCRVSSTDCDPLNAVFYNATGFKDKSVLVGALDQAGGRIASYSNRAGNYADRFLVADGRGLLRPDGTYDQGTSFAAPRVAGYAAILRQKFPNLNATQTASVLLETAQWNSAWGERSASTLAIYGQGEAHLGRALAPVGLLR